MLLTDLQKTILENKGFDLENETELEKFLNPNWERDLLEASEIKHINKAIEKIKKALSENQKIVIYADYDCDGIPGAVILHDFFEKLNYQNFDIYIPHRHKEGFGLNPSALKKIKATGGELIITIDLGITNLEEVKFAKELGLEMIITDHHLPITNDLGEQILPEAFAIINTKQTGDKYREKYLCGASTIWKLVNAFLNKYRKEYEVPEGYEKWLLDMVAIATVADLVPLQNENRLLAKYGLLVLKKSPRPGLQRILTNAKVEQKNLAEDDIAFAIAPRINSASRMAEPMLAYYALLNNPEAVAYAEQLEKQNSLRKVSVEAANQNIDYQEFTKQEIILTGNEYWTPGILGLIASKISETTGKTTFVWGVGEEKNILKGSVRSGKDNYQVVEIMQGAKNILENFGGHEKAGGFSLALNNLEKFQKFLKVYSQKKNPTEEIIQNKKDIEEESFITLKLTEINKKLFKEIKIFAPFGVENKKINFKIKLAPEDLIKSKRFGKKSEHLEITLNGIRGIEFFVTQEREQVLKNKKEFLVNLEWDNYRNDIVLKFLK